MYFGLFAQTIALAVAKGAWEVAKLAYVHATTSKEELEAASRKRELDEIAEEEKRRSALIQRQADRDRKESERVLHRDANEQVKPYRYRVDRHANEALAYRYGIANTLAIIKGQQRSTSDAPTILLRKINFKGGGRYVCELAEFRNRKVMAVIEHGGEYVKTFLPMKEDWFQKFGDFETAIKGGRTFTLKELAKLHIEKTVPSPNLDT